MGSDPQGLTPLHALGGGEALQDLPALGDGTREVGEVGVEEEAVLLGQAVGREAHVDAQAALGVGGQADRKVGLQGAQLGGRGLPPGLLPRG